MRSPISLLMLITLFLLSCHLRTQAQNTNPAQPPTHLYIDVHYLEPGKVTYAAVADAHRKDLAVEDKYGVKFVKFWVDEAGGKVYCLSSAPDTDAIKKTHAEAHGLMPGSIYLVTDGAEAVADPGKDFYLDVHKVGPGKVTAGAAAEAHKKDLATQKKYGVNFVNYWVNEQDGVILCLSQAADSTDVLKTHKEAHGLMPEYIIKVKQGN
ncbi:DUF4242 domain-containing protein [Puia sp.]|uniref:DUF4242 domain-containing protein n=1 Tax=Puia sp. TaxID=2045100 RepID=UPI002F410C09